MVEINGTHLYNKNRMKRTKVIDVLKRTDFGSDILVKGWVRSKRGSKGIFFYQKE